MAADICRRCANPATSRVRPKTESSSASSPPGEVPAHVATPTHRDPQDPGHGGEGDGDGLSGLRRVFPRNERGNHREVHRHGQVFDDEDVQYGGGFSVPKSAEIAQHLGNHAGRTDPCHPAEEQ